VTRRVVVTGASGFVGRHLCAALVQRGFAVMAINRRPDSELLAMGVSQHVVPDIAAVVELGLGLLAGDCVVHLAGRAHVMHQHASGADEPYLHNNLATTRVLIEQSVNAGAARMILLSSVKVFGDGPFTVQLDPRARPSPTDAYGRSKLAAEHLLLAQGSALEGVIVRPPLIYGPHVRANFLQLIRVVDRGVPLPLALVNNMRSFINVWNLCDLIALLLEKPDSVAGIWHASDSEDCSTADLIRELAALMGKSARLFPLPKWLLCGGMSLAGRRLQYDRLIGSLQLDVTKTMSELSWRPPISRHEGLARTLAWYFSSPSSDK
jgi:nucleoside-diphosphate-sugar epimerase